MIDFSILCIDNTKKHREQKPGQTTNSLRFKIGLFYSLLALLNIIFFTVMIFENQSDLLLKNFQFQSENLANTILTDISSIGLSGKEDESYELFRKTLKLYEIENFVIFNSEGTIQIAAGKELGRVGKSVSDKIKKNQRKFPQIKRAVCLRQDTILS